MKASLIGSMFLLAGTTAFAQEIQFEEVTATAFPTIPSGHDRIQSAIFTDFNNDGYPDLLIAGGNRPLLFLANRHNGTFPPVFRSSGTSLVASALLPADFDNDGRADLLAAGTNGLQIHRNHPSGSFFQPAAHTLSTEEVTITAIADFDLDGRLDVFAAGENGAMPQAISQ